MQFLHLLFQDLLLMPEHGKAQADGIIALQCHFNVLPDVLDRHSGLFHASDDLQPLDVGFPEHADSSRGALHKGQQALLVIITQRRSRDAQKLCHFSYCVKHRFPSMKNCKS